MFLRILVLTLLAASLVQGTFYKKRYDGCKKSVKDLLIVDPGQSKCRFVKELQTLVTGCNCGITASESSAFSAWLQNIEATIIADASLTVEAKLVLIGEAIASLETTQAVLFGKMGYLTFGGWGILADIVPITVEMSLTASFDLVFVRADGGCALFDKLIVAAQTTGDATLVADLQAFIDADLKVLIGAGGAPGDIMAAIYAAFEAKFFVLNPTYRATLLALQLSGFGSFNLFWQGAFSYRQQVLVETTMAGEGFDCPLILALNATLQDASFSLSQKGQIKQFMNYLIQQFTVDISIEARMEILSAKFVEFIDLNPSFFSFFARIQIQGFGSFYQLIIGTCQIGNLPTPLPLTNAPPTDLPITSASSTVEVTTEVTTEAVTEASTPELSTLFTLPSTSATSECSCVCGN